MGILTLDAISILLPLFLLSSTFGAMVLPRPPSYSNMNHIHQDHQMLDRKLFEGKSLQSVIQSASIERADNDDYRLLELELQSPAEVEALDFRGIVHATVLQAPEPAYNKTYPQAEIVPNSALGVRNIGPLPNFRLNSFPEEKRMVFSPLPRAARLPDLDEKLYYLKNGRPKVYVNVRGHSGSHVKSYNGRTTPVENLSYIHVTQPFYRPSEWKLYQSKKAKVPKKYDRRYDTTEPVEPRGNLQISKSTRITGQAAAYNLDDLATTENSMVTSSELPKQIPAPPSKDPFGSSVAHTTPVQRLSARELDSLPGQGMSDD